MIHMGDIISTSGGDTMSILGMFSTSERYHDLYGEISWFMLGMFVHLSEVD